MNKIGFFDSNFGGFEPMNSNPSPGVETDYRRLMNQLDVLTSTITRLHVTLTELSMENKNIASEARRSEEMLSREMSALVKHLEAAHTRIDKLSDRLSLIEKHFWKAIGAISLVMAFGPSLVSKLFGT